MGLVKEEGFLSDQVSLVHHLQQPPHSTEAKRMLLLPQKGFGNSGCSLRVVGWATSALCQQLLRGTLTVSKGPKPVAVPQACCKGAEVTALKWPFMWQWHIFCTIEKAGTLTLPISTMHSWTATTAKWGCTCWGALRCSSPKIHHLGIVRNYCKLILQKWGFEADSYSNKNFCLRYWKV